MSEPLVCAIMLTKDRPEMARRAVASFRAQAYANRVLFVVDSGETFEQQEFYTDKPGAEIRLHRPELKGKTIGELRNFVCACTARANTRHRPEIIIHWDDDDYSHPNRIAEQVELLQSSGADCVGYNEVLFWRTWGLHSVSSGYPLYNDLVRGEAWIYRSPRMSPAIGSSLCYWRSTWERRPFADAPKAQGATSEYYEWLRHCKVVASTGLRHRLPDGSRWVDMDPRLICSIHGGNTQCYDIEALIAQGSREWTRAQGFDAYARKVMAL